MVFCTAVFSLGCIGCVTYLIKLSILLSCQLKAIGTIHYLKFQWHDLKANQGQERGMDINGTTRVVLHQQSQKCNILYSVA